MKLLAAWSLALTSPSMALAAPEPPLDVAAIRSHIAYLADDALEGRAPGTAGADKAVLYIATEMQRAGLSPGAKDGGWYQPVSLVERVPQRASSRWMVGDRRIEIVHDQSQFVGRDSRADIAHASVIFAGYGIDQKGSTGEHRSDVAGKVVLLLSGKPEGDAPIPPLEERRRALAAQGAVAVIALVGAKDPWVLIQAQLARGRTQAEDSAGAAVEGAMSYPAWHALITASEGGAAAGLIEAAQNPDFKPRDLRVTLDLVVDTAVRRYQSFNVIGRIAGVRYPDEAVMYLAHWDHLGRCRPPGVADRICNGAVDNASGVAVMIEVARRLSQGEALSRSAYFVATTAEEMGLLGARALTADPPVPIDHIAAALNFDTVAIAPAGEPVAVIGRGQTRLDRFIDRAARVQKRAIVRDEAANSFLRRQDGWELMKAGVPAVMVGGAFSDVMRLAAFLASDYHSPDDHLTEAIPLDGAAEDGALHVVLGRMLADPKIFPLSPQRAR